VKASTPEMTMKISTMSTRPVTVSLVLVSMRGSKCEGEIGGLVAVCGLMRPAHDVPG
jgi:hypothetical protein